MKKILSALLCICIISGFFPLSALAKPTWPSDVAIEAEGGIVIDAETGAVLYGRNIHASYFPASITKILTALVVLENSDLDEVVTFSRNAVYNVEAGSTNMAADTGDQLTVRDCLYGLLLKSANEAGNALAEHISGSIEEFAVLMNEKAKALGCTESNFANPSGLNNPDHYTTAYDMALIAKAAFENETFMEIDSTLYYDLPATKRNPDGLRIYSSHKMMRKDTSHYYPGVVGGKTGYTSLAGNTLVTFAEKDGLKLISVILNGHQTHYTDSKALLDFGFKNFVSVPASTYDLQSFLVENEMTIAGLEAEDMSSIQLDLLSKISIPKRAELTDVSSELIYDITEPNAPAEAIAQIQYSYDQRKIGSAYLLLKSADTSAAIDPGVNSSSETEENRSETATPAEPKSDPLETTASKPKNNSAKSFEFSGLSIILIAISSIVVLILAILFYKKQQQRKEEQSRLLRRQRRLERLASSNISPSEFEHLLKKKRSSAPQQQPEGLYDILKKIFPFLK